MCLGTRSGLVNIQSAVKLNSMAAGCKGNMRCDVGIQRLCCGGCAVIGLRDVKKSSLDQLQIGDQYL